MRFEKFFQPNQSDQLHTVKLGNEQGAVKSGTSSHGQHYSRRKELESNRKHVGAYHASKIAQGHLVNRRSTPQPTRASHPIDIVRRPGGISRASSSSRPSAGSGYRFTEPPSRKRPTGY